MAREDEKRRDTESLVIEQRSLLDQMRQFQQHQARQSYDQGRRELSSQLRTQREDIAQGRRTLAEQAHMAQRQIKEGAGARGLGSSGMRNLAALQSQMEQGRATTDLERASTELTRAGMLQSQSMREALTSQLMQSELGYAQGSMDLSRQARDWGLEDANILWDLMRETKDDDEKFSSEEIAVLAAKLGIDMTSDLGDVLGEDYSGKTMGDFLTGEDTDISDELKLLTTHSSALEKGLSWFDPTAYVRWGGEHLADLFREPDKKRKMDLRDTGGLGQKAQTLLRSLMAGFSEEQTKRNYVIDGNRVEMTGGEALDYAKEVHKDKKYVKNGEVSIVLVPGGNIGYMARGKQFKSYSEAVKEIEKKQG